MDAREMRRALRAAAERLGIDAEAEYDRAAGWEWVWTDGPTPEQVAAELGQEAAGRVALRRRLSPGAAVVAAVVAVRDGAGAGRAHAEAPAPEVAPDERAGALAAALSGSGQVPGYEADDPRAVERHLRRMGLAVLLRPYAPGGSADAGAMTALEHLTDRYAGRVSGEAALAWRERLETVEPRAAALAALADPEADRATRIAAVALLGDLRAELERLELEAMDRATEAGASYADLGQALGVARQVAHRRHRLRAGHHPARLSPRG